MINEGSRDAEKWVQFSFAITGMNYILKYVKTENYYLKF